MSSTELRAVPRQERSAKAIDAILDAAVRLAARDGLESLSTMAVAKEAKISVGKVYYWFEDKTALIEAARTRSETDFYAFLETSLQPFESDDASALVGHYVSEFMNYVADHPGSLDLLDSVADGEETSPFRQRMRELVGAILEVHVPSIADDECALVTEMLISTVVGIARDLGSGDDRDHRIAEAGYLLYAYINGRYPAATHPTWNSTLPLRPARPSTTQNAQPIYPTLAPRN